MSHSRVLMIVVSILALGLLPATVLLAQSPPAAPAESRDSDGLRTESATEALADAIIDEFRRRTGLDTEEPRLQRFERIVRIVLRDLSADQLESLRAKGIREQVHEMPRLWDARRRARLERDERLLRQLPPEEQREIAALDPASRRRRLVELRSWQNLEKAIRTAMRQGLLTEIEVDELGDEDLSGRIAETRELNKRSFLHLYEDELPEAERRRLESLPADHFWQDRLVQRFRLLRGVTRRDLIWLRTLDEAERGRMLQLVSVGSREELERSGLQPRTAQRIVRLSPEERRRLSRELERVHLPRRRFGIGKRHRDQLTLAEQAVFSGLTDEARLAFLQERFPEVDWGTVKRRFEARRELEDLLLVDVPSLSLSAFRTLTVSQARARLHHILSDTDRQERADRALALLVEMGYLGRGDRRAMGRRLRPWIERLAPDERDLIRSLPLAERLEALRKRFPNATLPELPGPPRGR